MTKKIAVIIGSLRKESLNRKIAKILISIAPKSLQLEIVEIANLPLYNQDYDDEGLAPSEWTNFREKIKSFDGVLFVTPEYNRSIPGALKNAIDVGSRPYGDNAWRKKPGAVISVSPSSLGGSGASANLRQSLVGIDVPTLAQPEAYIAHAHNLFDASGNITNEGTRKFLQEFMDAFAKWVETNS